MNNSKVKKFTQTTSVVEPYRVPSRLDPPPVPLDLVRNEPAEPLHVLKATFHADSESAKISKVKKFTQTTSVVEPYRVPSWLDPTPSPLDLVGNEPDEPLHGLCTTFHADSESAKISKVKKFNQTISVVEPYRVPSRLDPPPVPLDLVGNETDEPLHGFCTTFHADSESAKISKVKKFTSMVTLDVGLLRGANCNPQPPT